MRRLLAVLLLAVPLLADGPEFEAAAIKQFVIPARGQFHYGASGGPGTSDPTHLTMSATPIRDLLVEAFGLESFRVIGAESLVMYANMFDFAVVIPAGATKEEVSVMWRNLLISRFGLKYHAEQREFEVDQLVIAPRGHKLIENTEAEPQPQSADAASSGSRSWVMKDGRPVMIRPGIATLNDPDPERGAVSQTLARAQPISKLTELLSKELDHPVVDKTGLTSRYDFTLEFIPRWADEDATIPSSNIAAAMQQQLGLRLVKGKSMLDVIVIDKINHKPTEN